MQFNLEQAIKDLNITAQNSPMKASTQAIDFICSPYFDDKAKEAFIGIFKSNLEKFIGKQCSASCEMLRKLIVTPNIDEENRQQFVQIFKDTQGKFKGSFINPSEVGYLGFDHPLVGVDKYQPQIFKELLYDLTKKSFTQASNVADYTNGEACVKLFFVRSYKSSLKI